MSALYWDHNASTPPFPEVVELVGRLSQEFPGNPGSQHVFGRKARVVLEDAREALAGLLGLSLSRGDQLVFTSGGTESNNLAIAGLSGSAPAWASSRLEHPSVHEPILAATMHRGQWREWPVLPTGQVNLDWLHAQLTSASGPRLVACCHASGETGVLQPVVAIAVLCAQHGAGLHVDALQTAGKCSLRELWQPDVLSGPATLALGAHKFGGPRGVGALAIRRGVRLLPQSLGGFQHAGLRPGTEPIALCAGMVWALQRWERQRAEWHARMTTWRNELQQRLLGELPDLVVHGSDPQVDQRLPHVLNVGVPQANGAALLMQLEVEQLAVSIGTACQSGSLEPSPALIAMGVPPELALASLRISLGHSTQQEEIEPGLQRLVGAIRNQRALAHPTT